MKNVLLGIASSFSFDVLRGYVKKRIKSIDPDKLVKAIENNDVNIIGKLSEKDWKIAKVLLKAAKQKNIDVDSIMNLVNTKTVFQWLFEDVPFYAGIIYGHPNGIKWLNDVIEHNKMMIRKILSEENTKEDVELVEVDDEKQ